MTDITHIAIVGSSTSLSVMRCYMKQGKQLVRLDGKPMPLRLLLKSQKQINSGR